MKPEAMGAGRQDFEVMKKTKFNMQIDGFFLNVRFGENGPPFLHSCIATIGQVCPLWEGRLLFTLPQSIASSTHVVAHVHCCLPCRHGSCNPAGRGWHEREWARCGGKVVSPSQLWGMTPASGRLCGRCPRHRPVICSVPRSDAC